MFPQDLLDAATTLLDRCRTGGLTLVTAESCTGGLVAGCLTAIPGSSDVVDRGFVTYSNEAKIELLGTPKDVIEVYGAVSEETARAMATAALERCRADVSVAVTGVAGPGGGTPEKPVGLVHFASASPGRETLHARFVFDGDRAAVRLQSVAAAIVLLRRQVEAAT